MIKIIAVSLLVFFIVAQNLDQSVDIGQGSASELPSIVPPVRPSAPPPSFSAEGSGGSSNDEIIKPFILSPQQPDNWRFLLTDSLGEGTNWISPSNFQVKPLNYLATYTIKFRTDCTKKGVVLKFSSTGSTFAALNGKVIFSWKNPYPQQHKVLLQSPELLCGCNTLKIYVYNYYYASPAALIYHISQDTSGCYECKNLGVTFYNKKTCQCECASKCQCSSALKQWNDYPACGCKCKDKVVCRPPQYLDWKTCRCSCPQKCCPRGTQVNPLNCQCQRPCIRQRCNPGFIWDDTKCQCIKDCSGAAVTCMNPKFWSRQACKCVCPRFKCAPNYYLDESNCACRCGILCIATMTLNPNTCTCEPILFTALP